MPHDVKIETAILLESDLWRVALEPDMGVQTQFCKIRHRGEWLDIMPDCSTTDEKPDATSNADPRAALSASNFHMLPYSNRVRDGQFTHNGQRFTLENTEAHAIHGALRQQPWRVVAQTARSLSAEYDSRSDGDVNWPWPISAQIRYSIEANSLVSVMRLTNQGDNSMPAGMGWHPYFSRVVAGSEARLTLPVTGVYPDSDGDCLPIGAPVDLADALDFTNPKNLNSGQRIDHCFAGFQSPATLAWPNAGITLKMVTSTNCKHLVLYNPDSPFFAVEPVTNANDGFNLEVNGISAGVVELAAGDTLQAEMRLELVQDH